jgi:serine/threonine protein kinase
MATEYVPPRDETATQHDGTEHLAINNTFLRRSWLLFAYKAFRRLRIARYAGDCLLLSKRLIVKTGPYVHLTEGATMQFVGDNTSVPVSRVYFSFVHRNQAYIVMERLSGIDLSRAWHTLSEAQIDNICAQLRRMLEELRTLSPPSETVAQSCVGGSLRDFRIPQCRPRMGPFKTIQEFHLWVRRGLRPEEHPESLQMNKDWVGIGEMVAKQDGSWPPPAFTHADLNPSNIMVEGDKVVGIIDWEWSGSIYWRPAASILLQSSCAVPMVLPSFAHLLKTSAHHVRHRRFGLC